MTQVKIGDIEVGQAPVTLPCGQVHHLLRSGDFIVDSKHKAPPASTLRWEDNGSLTFLTAGQFHIVNSSTQDKTNGSFSNSMGRITPIVGPSRNRDESTNDHGLEDDLLLVVSGSANSGRGRQRGNNNGSGLAASPSAEPPAADAAEADKRTIRTAQFVCGISGLIMINLILLYDVAGRGANVKDFLINFASDITALGAVLIIAEAVDKRVAKAQTKRLGLNSAKKGNSASQPSSRCVSPRAGQEMTRVQSDEPSLHRQPITLAT